MANVDSAVRYSGKLYRLVTDGEKGALFDKSGISVRLNVESPVLRRGLPTLTTASGEDVSLVRSGKPCSCKGAPWNTPSSTLRGQL